MFGMEITIEIFKETLTVVAEPNEVLAQYYAKWFSHTFEDIVNARVKEIYSNDVWSEISIIKRRMDFAEHYSKSIAQLATISTYLKEMIKDAFEENNTIAFLVFLDINSSLKLPIQSLLNLYKVSFENVTRIVAKIEEVLKTFYVNLDIPSNAPYHEKEFFRAYNEGI